MPQQLQHRSRIPKFGSWDSSDSSTPFTELFDDARVGRGNEEVLAGRLKNSHPQKINPTEFQKPRGGAGAPVSHHRKPSSEEHSSSSSQQQQRQIEPPAYHIIDDSRYVPQMNHSHSANESGSAARLGEPLGGTISSNSNPTSSSSGNASKHSPAHRGVKNNGNSSSSPSWERKSEASSTPGRSRLRNTSSIAEAEKAPALPKFGAWDSNDPSSADGFTVIFNNARNVKKSGGSIHIPPLGFDDKDLYPDRRSTTTTQPKPPGKKLFCCFQSPEAMA